MTLPMWKAPAPWTYQPRGPYFLITLGPDVPPADTEYDDFDEVLRIFVRQRMPPPTECVGAVILDNDGVIVLGWSCVLGWMQWLGIKWGHEQLEQFPFLDPLSLQEAQMQIKNDPDVLAPS